MQLSEDEIENLSIDKFIFHVVHHRNDEPILLDETPIGDFEDFFLERAMETLRGNRFTFADGSITRTLLKQVLDDESQFVPVSKTMAQTFHAGRDKRIKPGVMILMTLVTGQRKLLSVLKYDHEEAVIYQLGLVLYRCLTGFNPQKRPQSVTDAIQLDVRKVAGASGGRLDALLASMLETDPSKRPTAKDVLQRLNFIHSEICRADLEATGIMR